MSGTNSRFIVGDLIANNTRSSGASAAARAGRRGVVRAAWCWLTVCVAGLGVLSFGAASASAIGPPTCIGTPEHPGVLVGRFTGNVAIEGTCFVNSGPTVVDGNLVVRPGSTLVAAFGRSVRNPSEDSTLRVRGNLRVRSGATLFLGCNPANFPCLDDPNPETPTLSSRPRVLGNLISREPLGVVVHNTEVLGNVRQAGGGGGVTCEPQGSFATLAGSPVYSTYEASSVAGILRIEGLNSCWLGVVSDHVGGNLTVVESQLFDPDAIEILENQVTGNLRCRENSMVWNSEDEVEGQVFPRRPAPNRVGGRREGECVLASPTEEGGPLGPGPF